MGFAADWIGQWPELGAEFAWKGSTQPLQYVAEELGEGCRHCGKLFRRSAVAHPIMRGSDNNNEETQSAWVRAYRTALKGVNHGLFIEIWRDK
jgi:hypothetical protein